MTHDELAYIILFSVPAYTALICGLLMVRMSQLKESPFERGELIQAIVLYLISMLVWLSFIVYTVLPEIYVMLNSFLFLACLLVYAVSYRFVFEVTKVNQSEKFPKIHYLFPLSGFIVMQVWSFFVPWEVRLSLVRSGGIMVEGYQWYSIFFDSNILLLLCMNLTYTLLGLRRIVRYRKVVVNFSADEYRGSVGWLYQFIYTSLAMFVVEVCIFMFSINMRVPIWLLPIPAVFAVFKYVILTHNVLLENFVIIKTDPVDSPNTEYSGDTLGQALKIRHLEAYMHKNKPYLNPKLKITEVVRELNTNRTTLSLLINRTYGMNFCRYVNRFRLKEFEEIKSNPKNVNLSKQELVIKAGFSDYRGYRRVKQHEEMNIQI